MPRVKIAYLAIAFFVLTLGSYIFFASRSSAITGPLCSAGTCSGAIGVDSSNDISIGTSTPWANTRVLITGLTNGTAGYWPFKVTNLSGTAIITVQDNGYVGIGTSTFNAKLSIGGTPGTDGIRFPDGTLQTSAGTGATISANNVSFGQFGLNTGGGNYSFPVSLSISTTTAPSGGVLFVNGNVGIGTAAPSAKLHVVGGARITGLVNCNTIDTDASGNLVCGTDATGSGVTGSGSSNYVAKWTSATSIADSDIYNTNTGRIGIGTAAPASTLSVGGAGVANTGIYGTGSTNGVYGSSGGTAGVYGVGGTRGVWGYTGSVGGSGVYGSANSGTGVYGNGGTFGVEGNGGTADFYANHAGSGTAAGGAAYASASSIRWKENITTIPDALGKVMALNGVYFDWKKDYGGQHDVGLIAEDVRKVLPEVVIADKDAPGYDVGLDYSRLTPLLIEAIKSQQEAIKNQQKEIDELRAEIKALKK